MTKKTLWRWEQDGAGGENGIGTFFPDTPNEVAIPLPTFKDGHVLHQGIEAAIKNARWDARRELLDQIGRIDP